MDATPQISFVLNDFEGAFYSTWSGYNFIPIKVEDDSSNVLFRGYLTGKRFSHNKLYCTAHGLSIKLDWVPFHKNYILEEGLVKNVPATQDYVAETQTIYPNANGDTNDWSVSAGTHWEAVLVDDDSDWVAAVDGNEDDVEEFNFGIPYGTVNDVAEIKVYTYGKNINNINLDPEIDIYVNGAYLGGVLETVNLGSSYAWATTTYDVDGTGVDNTDVAAFKLKYIAPAAIAADEGIYIKGVYVVLTYDGDSVNAIDLTDSDGDAFTTWSSDSWVNNQDAGILIRDTTDNWSTRTWTVTAIVPADHTATAGNAASCQTQDDDDEFEISDTLILDATAAITVGGTAIDSDLEEIKEIRINYNIGTYLIGPLAIKSGQLEYRYNETDWKYAYKRATLGSDLSLGDSIKWVSGTKTLTGSSTELAKYLNSDWDEMENMRIRLDVDSTAGANTNKILIDFLEVEIDYFVGTNAPVMEKIEANGDSYIYTSNFDFANGGVQGETAPGEEDGDTFQIGASSTTVLIDLFNEAEVGLDFITTPSYYIAQHYKGTYCKDVLEKIRLLEGFHWWEYPAYNTVIIGSVDDLTDSAVDLTSADYGYDWEFEDDYNYYGAVEVYGAAGYNIYYKATSITSDSPRVKTIIEETITTKPEAKEVAVAELAELEAKQPSIKLTLNGVNSALRLGTTVGLTMERPTVVEANYPIRMIEREKFGGGIKTTIYCGLGHSTPSERIADFITNSMRLARKAHTDRLISTNFAPGATFTWSDVGGAQAAVEAIITTEVGAGQSIDNAIDALIAAAGHETVANVEAYLGIGAANKRWIDLIPPGASDNSDYKFTSTYENIGADDMKLGFLLPLPLVIGSKNLYITRVRIGIYDADEGDEIDRIRWYGWSDYDTFSLFLDTAAGLDEDTPSEYIWDHADTQIGGVYKSLILYMATTCTNAGDLNLAYVQVEYYYA
jgi:hypothetical protein